MTNLNNFYSTLFEESKKFEKMRMRIYHLLILAMGISIFISGDLLLLTTILSVTIQILMWIMKYQSNRNRSYAHELQNIAMLIDSYEKNSPQFNISHFLGKISSAIHRKVANKQNNPESATYNLPIKSKGPVKLRYMIHENAFWNYHLYKKSSTLSIIKLSLYCTFIIIGIVFVILTFPTDPDYSILRVVLIGLSSIYIWEELDRAFLWRNSSQKMNYIDSRLEAVKSNDEEFIMLIFHEYNHVRAITPWIPEIIYNEERKKLNQAWAEREREILVIDH